MGKIKDMAQKNNLLSSQVSGLESEQLELITQIDHLHEEIASLTKKPKRFIYKIIPSLQKKPHEEQPKGKYVANKDRANTAQPEPLQNILSEPLPQSPDDARGKKKKKLDKSKEKAEKKLSRSLSKSKQKELKKELKKEEAEAKEKEPALKKSKGKKDKKH